MIRYLKNNYILDKDIYKSELIRKNITEEYKFICSLYDGDIFDIKTPTVEGRFKFRGVNNEKNNQISVDYINKSNASLIISLKEIKKEIEKSPNERIANKVNKLLGTSYNEMEAKEYLLNVSLSSKQKVITFSKIEYLRKKLVDILGNVYNSEESLKKILKK